MRTWNSKIWRDADDGAGGGGSNGTEDLPPEGDEGGGAELKVEDLQAELDRVRSALSDANAESRDRRLTIKELKTQLADLQTQFEEKKGAQMSETDKLQKQLREMEEAQQVLLEQNRRLLLRRGAATTAIKLGVEFFSEEAVDDAVRHLDKDLDEDYELEDLEKVVKSLAKSRPYLFKERGPKGPPPDGSAGGTGKFEITEDEEAEIATRFGLKQ